MSDPYAHNPDYEVGREHERAAIVAWLSGQYRTANGYFTHVIAEALRNGEHLRGDDE